MGTLKLIYLTITVVAFSICCVNANVESNKIYSFDNRQSERGTTLSLTVDPDTKKVVLRAQNASNPHQRFIARVNSGSTFNLFPEVQPWNWVDHIVETTRYVRIRKIPQILGVVGGTKEVVEQNYLGRNANSQKWYLVSTGSEPNTGVITNLQHRLCLTGQGENEQLTLSPCNWSDPNQIFKMSLGGTGERCNVEE